MKLGRNPSTVGSTVVPICHNVIKAEAKSAHKFGTFYYWAPFGVNKKSETHEMKF